MPVKFQNDDDFDGTRRRIELSQRIADRLGVCEGDLVELSKSSSAAALRAWVYVGNSDDGLSLGPTGFSALGVNPGDRVEIRALSATSV